MNIAKHTVATIHYTLTDTDGHVLDTSKGGEPLAYIHGIGAIIPGLEAALEGKAPGENLTVSIPPQAGYGERDESLIHIVSRQQFDQAEDLEVGMQFRARTDTGSRIMTIVGIDGNQVTLDGNHPLAGETLNFDVTVVDVRQATEEELNHGHAHSGDGHVH